MGACVGRSNTLLTMRTTLVPIFTALSVAALCAFVWYFAFSDGKTFGGVAPSMLSVGVPYTGAPLTKSYANKEFRFSLTMPEGFSAGELPADEGGGRAVVLQNAQGDGIQIYVVPLESDTKVLTADDIRREIPDMKVEAEEPVTIGPEYTGVAFLSDNDAFGGASREVWFYFRGNLYQISTYQRLDTLLKAMFATWKFY